MTMGGPLEYDIFGAVLALVLYFLVPVFVPALAGRVLSKRMNGVSSAWGTAAGFVAGAVAFAVTLFWAQAGLITTELVGGGIDEDFYLTPIAFTLIALVCLWFACWFRSQRS